MYRDAVISHPGNGGLTYDRDRAYAVVIEGPEDEETVSVRHGGRGDSDWAPKYPPREVEGTEDILRYKVTRKDARVGKGVFKVMRTMASPDEDRKVVRVFRAWKTVWENAPLGGVRYEGLYRVTNYSIRLSPPNEWTYIFTLAREEAQAPLSTITHIPTPEQMDDWEDYQAMGRQPLKTPQYEVARIHTGMGGLKFVDEKDANERDSGYFSLRNG
ncbi:uncharacterized protein KY384_006598 [Bacidia gigantensis]|uniref:uncharacterized protein n=1 Tax=Bacidia gigantensis TaxID=2732470 RepID=UPI001D04BE07|nr:uncharacterized protein KY384_006598 [Bacidia gigantensis]KAG8528909.1 hypothetical protein KY384_006598 [Bacidia gigantensis]